MRRSDTSQLAGPIPLAVDGAPGASLVPAGRHWELHLGPLPAGTADAVRAGTEAVRAGAVALAEHGGGDLRLWVRGPDERRTSIAEAAGMVLGREVIQMRRPLPVEDGEVTIDVRPFVVGVDEDAWLAVNNRAFAWHPEQGGWTRAALEAREREPWFDPNGFLLHEVDGRLVGFCWTKVHADHDPPLGEIFVIAVDPAAHHRGLGRQLVLAGLDHLARAGLPVGMLWVEATNEPALRLYDELGFTVHCRDRAYDLTVTGR